MRHFRKFSLFLVPASLLTGFKFTTGPEVERRIAEYRAANGPVLFGGKLKKDTDFRLAVPDNLGANLVEPPRV